VALPFANLDHPEHVAVGGDGTVYVAASSGIVALDEGATRERRIPDGPGDVAGVAADHAGNLYATDSSAMTVSALAKGSTEWVTLPFTGLRLPSSVAVDAAGNVYVLDEIQRVVALMAR